jgi:hypothetical protein
MKVLKNDETDVLVKSIDHFAASLLDRLQSVLKESRSAGKLNNGSWKNPQNIFCGYVSFFPHRNPEEKTIDATLVLHASKNLVIMSADIYWSDGEMIVDFGDFEIGYSSLEDLSQKIQKIYSQIEYKMFQKMTEIITSNLSP